jgi:hypothetical protein
VARGRQIGCERRRNVMKLWKMGLAVAFGTLLAGPVSAGEGPGELVNDARHEITASKYWGHADGHLEKAEEHLQKAEELIRQDEGLPPTGAAKGKGSGSGSGSGSASKEDDPVQRTRPGNHKASDTPAKGDIEAARKAISEAKADVEKNTSKFKDHKTIAEELGKAQDEIKAGIAAASKSGTGKGSGSGSGAGSGSGSK